MQGSGSPSLSTTGLALRRGERLLVRGLDLALGPGEACHVAGANGTGKTTLLRALAGLHAPYAGTIDHRGAIGLVDERPALDPHQPLGKALSFWERIDGCPDSSLAFAALSLEPLLDVPVRFLSTGQRKRAAFAALLNRGAPIWLLDEPLSGLDAESIDKVNALISRHVGGGGIAVIASHQQLAIPELRRMALEDYVPSPEKEA